MLDLKVYYHEVRNGGNQCFIKIQYRSSKKTTISH